MIVPELKHHYVYLHRRNTDNAIFYVGKGRRRRAWSKCGRNRWWKHVEEKHGFNVQILKDNMTESCALSLERAMVHLLRRTTELANIVDGGGGTTGWKHSDEAKQRISAFNKGKKVSQKSIDTLVSRNLGVKRTPEQRLKLSLAKKGKPGRKMSPETRKKISESHRGMKHTKETLEKLSAIKKGKNIGKNSPSYDHTIRKFSHAEHGEFIGTRGDLILKYELPSSCLASLIKGKRKSVKGWVLL